MKRRMSANQKGFTLIELMIVVAIIGILAAIAIPNFLKYQLKSKTAEAKSSISAIRVSQEAFKAEYDVYASCAANPGAPGTSKQLWGAPAAGTGWPEIGFEPSGSVYYQYEVTAANNGAAAAGLAAGVTGTDMVVGAVGDLDGDLVLGKFGFATNATAAPAPGLATTAILAGSNCTADNALEDLAPGAY